MGLVLPCVGLLGGMGGFICGFIRGLLGGSLCAAGMGERERAGEFVRGERTLGLVLGLFFKLAR